MAKKSETVKLSALDRVRQERDELQQRLSRLCAFMDDRFEGCAFRTLSPANRILLERQKAVMQEYRDILDVRVELMESVRPDEDDLTSITVCASKASGKWNVTGVAVKPVAKGKPFGQLLRTVKDFLGARRLPEPPAAAQAGVSDGARGGR